VYRNLARVQRKLGLQQLAAASDEQAQMLASRDPQATGNVVWVTPAALATMGDPLAPPAPAASVAATPRPPQPRPANAPIMRAPVQNVSRLPGGYLR
jgi:hypothetical protein